MIVKRKSLSKVEPIVNRMNLCLTKAVCRLILPALIIASPFISTGASVNTVSAHGLPPANTSQMVEEDHYIYIPYFSEIGGLSSVLALNNNQPQPMSPTVTLFNNQGEAFSLPPVILGPRSWQHISLKEIIRSARGNFNSGNVQIFFHGPSMAITSRITISSPTQRVSFESIETEAMGFSSSKLDGIIWLPDVNTRASMALTNTTPNTITILTTSNQRSNRQGRAITLGAHETCLIDLNEFLRVVGGSTLALLTLEHNGAPGALIATGFAVNYKNGFSCNLPFIDRSTVTSTQLAGAHIKVGLSDSKYGFPAGTRFIAPLVIANAGDFPTQANISVDYTIDSVARTVDLGSISLAPQEIKQLEISQALASRGIQGPMDDAGVGIVYTGPAGSIIARLTSMDQSKDFCFDVPIKDPLEKMRGSGNTYPWRLDEGYTTVTHIKNTTDKPVFALVQVRYEGGSYNLERIKVNPYQTVAIDIKKLRDDQEQDIRGSVMPKDVERGQVIWFEEEVGSLIGRAEFVNVGGGLASSFSCLDTCNCPPSYFSNAMDPTSSAGPVGGTVQFRSTEMRRDCNGFFYGP